MELAAVVDNIRAFLLKMDAIDLPRELAAAAAELRAALDDRFKTATQEMQTAHHEQQRIQALLDVINLEIWYASPDQNLLMVNEAARRGLGLEPTQIVSIPQILEKIQVFDARGQPRPQEAAPMVRALRGETVQNEIEIVQHPGNGHLMYREVDAAPVKDAEGKILGAVASVRDMSRLRQLEAQKMKLYEIISALSVAASLDEVIQTIVETGLMSLTDYSGAVALLTEDKQFIEHVKEFGVPIKVIKRFRRVPIDMHAPMTVAVRQNKPIWIETPEQYAAEFPEIYRTVQPLTGTQALACIPLVADQQVIGGLGFGFRVPTPFSETDRTFLMTVANHCAKAIHQARLMEQIQEQTRQTQRLYEVTAALSQTTTLPEVIQVIEEKVFAPNNQFSGAVGLLSEDETRVDIVAEFGIPIEVMTQYRSIPIESNAGLSLAIRTRQPYWVETPEQYAALLPENYAVTQHITGVQALFTLPLMVGDRAIGGLAVGFQQPTPFSESTRHFYMSIANHCAKAIERAQLIEVLQKQAKTIQVKNQEHQEFAYIASHDLREPLRKVQQFTERLKADLQDKLDGRHLDYLNRIQASNNRMQQLLEHLLTYSRITSHAEPFQRVDLNKVLQNVLTDLEFVLQETGGKVTVEPLPTLDADPVQMQQLFQNLLHNALKFRHPDVPPEIKIRCQQEHSVCHVLVEDNGIGFEQTDAERIFLPFQRLHGRSQYEGYGMGLPICKRIVERHKGTITATSTVGAGAVFRVTLPLKQIGTRPLVLRGFSRD